MSSDPKVSMDFLGVGDAQRKPVDELKVERSALQYSLSRIKPQMMQRVLSSKGLLDKTKVESTSGKGIDVKGGCELKAMGTGFGLLSTMNYFSHPMSPRPRANQSLLPACSRSIATNSGKTSPSASAQLTIFYNGTVNVFDVSENKAQAIMTLAESMNGLCRNPNPPNPPSFTNLSSFSKENGTLIPGHGHASATTHHPCSALLNQAQTVHQMPMRADLPIARKQSLQRFLQKRKDRLTSTEPYDVALMHKVPKDKISQKDGEKSVQLFPVPEH